LVNKRILKGIKRKKIAKPEEKEVLREIITTSGEKLPEYHWKIYELNPKDCSYMFSQFLAEYLNAGNITERVWIQKENNGRVKEYPFDWDEENKCYYSQKLCETLTKEEVIELMVTPWENEDEKIQKIARKGYENSVL